MKIGNANNLKTELKTSISTIAINFYREIKFKIKIVP